MEAYLSLFEDAVKAQAELVGHEQAVLNAKQAGLGVTSDGQIVSCAGSPLVVLLRLIKSFTADGSLMALEQCVPLINKLIEATAELEDSEQSVTENA